MTSTLRHLAIILVVAVVVLFTNLGGPRLWDRDEPRNAGCTAEMLARGDLITPVFDDELRTHKPILLYWFMMTEIYSQYFTISLCVRRFRILSLSCLPLLIMWAKDPVTQPESGKPNVG